MPIPKSMALDELPEGYKLRRPIALAAHRDGEYYWVTSATGFLHGVGLTVEEAKEDYAYASIEYYELLKKQERLSPRLRSYLDQLNAVIIVPNYEQI